MLLSKTAMVNWNSANREYYIKKSYVFTKMKDRFEVNIDDLSFGSNSIIECVCDYCNDIHIFKSYHRYLAERKTTNKDCCNSSECQNKKREESMINKYGNRSARKLSIFIEKTKRTNLERYGCIVPMGNKNVQEKYKKTCLEIFGVSHASQSESIKDKKVQTCLEHFGVKNPTKSPIIKEKSAQTNLKKYGFKSPMQNEDIKNKSRKNAAKSRYKNGTVKSSVQQEYICNILNGKLNYPISRINVDILLDDNIVVEYNGGGHDLAVKLNAVTEEDFKKKENRRMSFILSRGYKIIYIISVNDKLPVKDKILEMVLYAIEYFNTDHSWVKFDIDNQKVLTSQFELNYDYGELIKMTINNAEQFYINMDISLNETASFLI